MNNLYYVVAYNFHLNQYTRLMLTAPSDDAAIDYVHDNLAKDWKVTKCMFICETTEDVSIEV